jgi:phage terminase large subunit GpA-like protein
LNKAAAAIGKLLRAIFKPREILAPSAWVEKNIRLSSKTSNTPGKYSLNHTPYLRQIYDDIANPRIRKVAVKKGAQLGLTQFANNLLLYYVCNFTFPLLMVMPSKESAQQFCERSLTPSVHDCDAIRPFLTGNDDDLKKTEFIFTSCIVRVIGAGSPSKLASNPAAVCIVDECDKLQDFAAQGESTALELAEDRTISFPHDKKIVILSTPTEANTSVIHAQYFLGSQSKYFVACPQCRAEQTLIFDQIKWPSDCKADDGSYDFDRIEREAFYECATCKTHLTERDKLSMVRAGQWKDTNEKPFPAEIRSYHISALYSFNVTWGGLAKIFLLSKDDPAKLRNFYNSYLGECFEQRAATVRESDLDKVIAASPKFRRGELISKPDAIVLGCDTQGSSFWWAAEALYPDGTASVIDWGEAQTFHDLTEIFRRTYRVKGTEDSFGAWKAVIDMGGNRTEQVKGFCVSTGFRFIPIVGRTEKQGLFSPVRETTFHYKQYNIPGLVINDKTFCDILFLAAIKECSGKLFLPTDIDEDLRKQLTAFQLVQKKNQRGQLEAFWQSSRTNHLGDCLKYLEGLRYALEPQLRAARLIESEDQKKREYTLRNEIPAEDYQTASNWG